MRVHRGQVGAAPAAWGVALGVVLACASATGSPWVLPESATVLQLDFRTEFADREFLPDGTNQDFPINGKFSSQTLGINVRHGFGEGFEGSLALSYKAVAFSADPVTAVGPIAIDPITTEATIGQILPTFAVNKQDEGLADIYASVRYNLLGGPLLITPELEVKIPGGYESPSGTFVNDDPGLVPNPDQEGAFVEQRTGDVNAADDVSLGDGQVDLRLSVLFGAFIAPSRTFARAGAGINFRFGGAGQQFVGDFKVGQLLGDNFIFFASTKATLTLTEGEVIGKSFATGDPDTPAQAFPLTSLEFIDLRLDKDALEFSGGAIFKVDAYEVILTGGKILWGQNISESVFASFSTSYRY